MANEIRYFRTDDELIEYVMKTEWLMERLYGAIDQKFYGIPDEDDDE